MDLKIGGIAAAVAFSLSLLIGIVSRSTMPRLIIWPFVFAVIFFVLFIGAKFLFGQFLPELLEDENSGSISFPGSVVNIVEGDTNSDEFSSDIQGELGGTFPLQDSNAARPDDSEKSIGDISTLSEVVARNKASYKETSVEKDVLAGSEGMDQKMENSYASMGDFDSISQSASPLEADASRAASDPSVHAAVKPVKSVKSGSSALFSDSDDTLPDLDSMMGVFANASSEEEPEKADHSEPSRSRKKSANKEQSLEGDFSPKDLAEGIRTVLKKDKEG